MKETSVDEKNVQQVSEGVQNVESLPEKKRKLRLIIIAIIVCFIILHLGIFSFFYFSPKDGSTNTPAFLTNMMGKSTPTPTRMPFHEVTIPYLRQQTYISKLGALEKISENDAYTSYITSYTSDGLKINGLLTQPKGEKPTGGFPAIIFVHGYIPPTQYQTNGAAYSAYIDYLARNGFVIFKIDLRGHADSEGEPSGAYYAGDYITDTLNAYAALQTTDFVNPKKIGLWGHSMAGNVTMRSLATKPDIPAVVIWAGAVFSYEDFMKYRISDSSYQPQMRTGRQARRQQLIATHGEPNKDTMFWQQVAPTSYLGDIKGAIQLHHAVDDDVVNVGYSRDLQTLLNKTSIPHEFYEYSSGGHNISDSNFTSAMQRTVEFFKKYLD